MATSANNPNGDIDRRIEKLVERHEALTQSVELHEHRIARLETIAESIPRIEALLSRMANIQESLAGIVLDHEARLKRGQL